MSLLRLALAAALMIASSALAQTQKPRVPPGVHPGGVQVAVIASGVNYTLPEIAARLARDGEGEIIGWDFESEDRRPFDRPMAAVRSGGRGWPATGTELAGVIVREAKAASLVAVRLKADEPLALAKAVALVSQTPARIALVLPPAGGRFATAEGWEPFRQVASHFRDILLVTAPVASDYAVAVPPGPPGTLGLANLIVVAGVAADGQMLGGLNPSEAGIDIAVPVAGLTTLRADGRPGEGERHDIAAARVAALAARLAAREPGLGGAALKARILGLAQPAPALAPIVRHGMIAAPERHAREE